MCPECRAERLKDNRPKETFCPSCHSRLTVRKGSDTKYCSSCQRIYYLKSGKTVWREERKTVIPMKRARKRGEKIDIMSQLSAENIQLLKSLGIIKGGE